MRPRGPFPLPTYAPDRDTCDVCGGPAGLARVLDGITVGAWCGTGCAAGCRAGDLTVGQKALVLISRFPEVGRWPVRRGSRNLHRAGFSRVVRRAVVVRVTAEGVVLTNARGRQPAGHRTGDGAEDLTLPADFPCTSFTGIVVDVADPAPRGMLVHRWPLDGVWTRDVSFDHWLSHQPQGTCEDDPGCDARASLWVCYGPDSDGRSCGRCLSRRLHRRVAPRPEPRMLRRPEPLPVAAWDPRLQAWDTRRYDGAARG